ncbi:MAG: hypothetical protein RI990_1089 [Planctomycetota bacterium]
MSTSPDAHRRLHQPATSPGDPPGSPEASHTGRRGTPRITRADFDPGLFGRANPFLDAVWDANERGTCIGAGCGECGALEFRRMLGAIDGSAPTDAVNLRAAAASMAARGGRVPPSRLATAMADLDFDLLRLAPRWLDALDTALFHARDHGMLGHVLAAWVRREAIPTRVLDLVLFRHARYGYPDERVADLWIERCLEAGVEGEDDGLMETLLISCPERVGAHPTAREAALRSARRSACVRRVIARLGDCA